MKKLTEIERRFRSIRWTFKKNHENVYNFIKTKGLHGYFERNGGSFNKAIANANRSMDEVQKDGRDYTYSELERLMKELKELEVV
jgi:hypothetical protein